MNGKVEGGVKLKEKVEENSESGSWSSSDERSSGNEYSVKLRNEVLSDEEALKELYERKKRRHKRRKKHRKKKQEKAEKDSPDEESDKKIVGGKKKLMTKVDEILDNCVSKDIESVIENKNGKDTEEKPSSRSRSGRSDSKDRKRSRSRSKDRKSKERSSSRSRTRHRSRSKSKDRRRSRSKSKDRKRSKSRDRRRSRSRSRDRRRRSRSKSRDRRRSRSRSRDRRRSRSRTRNSRRSRSRSRDRRRRSRSRSRDRRRSRSKSRDRRRRSRSRSRDRRRRSRSKSRDRRRRSRSKSRDRRRSRSKSRDGRRSRSPSKSKTEGGDSTETSSQSSMWDVKTVREPAEVSTDSVFQKVSALKRTGIAIKYGNKVTSDSTVKEKQKTETKNDPYGKWEPVPDNKKGNDLSKYMKICQEISAKESIYENHVVDSRQSSDEEDTRNIHHPFVAKPAPILPPPSYTSRIPMNPAQAIMAGTMNSLGVNPADIITGPLEKHFPVSSGTDHREKENARGEDADLPVYDEPTSTEEPINVSAIIARRMGAQQLLNANPSDAAARKVLDECDLKLKGWTERNRKPGKFTGERGVRMDKKQIAGAIETWVRKDFFHNLMPVCGGVGMRMMQNMGWKQGTPLGKNNEGYVAPITFDVKVGRGGLASVEEQPARGGGYGNHLPKKRLNPVQNVGGKHPVSALAEICSKKRLGQPEYTCVFESGSAHNKTFLIKCTIQNTDYQPSVASPNKKHAKAQAALTALKILGYEG